MMILVVINFASVGTFASLPVDWKPAQPRKPGMQIKSVWQRLQDGTPNFRWFDWHVLCPDWQVCVENTVTAKGLKYLNGSCYSTAVEWGQSSRDSF